VAEMEEAVEAFVRFLEESQQQGDALYDAMKETWQDHGFEPHTFCEGYSFGTRQWIEVIYAGRDDGKLWAWRIRQDGTLYKNPQKVWGLREASREVELTMKQGDTNG